MALLKRDRFVVHSEFLREAKAVEAGLPFSAISALRRDSGLTLERIKRVARISEGSFARRKKTGRFSPEESERLLRIARLVRKAVDLFDGDREDARVWLQTPIPALGNKKPLDLARTEPGGREVEDLIARIEHGIAS